MGLQLCSANARRARAPDAAPTRESGMREIEVARIRPTRTSRGDSSTIRRSRNSLRRSSSAGYCSRSWSARGRRFRQSLPASALARGSESADSAISAIVPKWTMRRSGGRADRKRPARGLNALEEAEAYRQLIDRHGHTQEGLAKVVHKSRSHIANLMRLIDLPEFVRDALLRGIISMGHARAVASAPDPEALARQAIAKGWSVRRTEDAARSSKTPSPHAGARLRLACRCRLAALERRSALPASCTGGSHRHGGTVTLLIRASTSST